MQFHLSFPVDPLEPGIQYSDKLLLMGSCFAEEIGARLQEHRFDTLINPHGILFNPVSITSAINTYLDGKIYTAADLFQHNDTWHSWDHHSRFSANTPEAALALINKAQETAIHTIEQADWLILTFGSAHAYALKETSRLVGNCHKVPAASFYKRMLTVEEIVTSLDNMMHRLFFRNSKVNILFTVSPVRYVRDGVVENNLSKAILLQAVHHLVNKFARLYYFPAYELVIDDLRDYRFYKEDMVHPNETAVNYVWEHVVKACVAPEGQQLLHTIADISRAAQHRPFNPQGSQHRQFLRTYADKVKQLKLAHPALPLDDLEQYFSA
ncbi:GSCFA domain-containing protein [Chitinophaga solisilvae]|uniref:GSCFA domain-containing protein n=1 Tax=Chitinophaga solisilvae TaxID=1233460 RepID=A0A433WLP0_9BACT|nr:GSCFA domain-containing protein [Chitinophaga solisilvae]NSL85250.1 GSCFA domain-containing protein [Chitinophaga solisilvae]